MDFLSAILMDLMVGKEPLLLLDCRTMCDFHDLFSLENVKKLFWVFARLSQRLKSMLFEIFSHTAGPFRVALFEKISKNVDFSV